jgi:hypothetical protein
MGCNCNKKQILTSSTEINSSKKVEETKSQPFQPHILPDTDSVYLQRVEICNSCEYRDSVKERCMKCGCFIKAKARLRQSHCPLPEPRW